MYHHLWKSECIHCDDVLLQRDLQAKKQGNARSEVNFLGEPVRSQIYSGTAIAIHQFVDKEDIVHLRAQDTDRVAMVDEK